VVHFSALSSLAGLIICIRGVTAVQLMLPLLEHPPAPRVIDCLLEVLKCGETEVGEPIGFGLHNS